MDQKWNIMLDDDSRRISNNGVTDLPKGVVISDRVDDFAQEPVSLFDRNRIEQGWTYTLKNGEKEEIRICVVHCTCQ